MTDPNTQTPPTDPQDLIDQALSGTTPPPTPETATDPAVTATPTITEPAPLPTPEPMTPSEPTKTPESAPEPTPEPTPEPAVMPSELVKPEESVAEAPQAMPSTEPAISTKASDESKPEEMIQPPIKMGEDVPLAFAPNAPTVEPVVATEAAAPPAEVPPANVPPAIVGSMTSAEPTPTQKPKKKGLKMVGLIAGFFLLFGVVGAVSYQMFTGESLIAAVFTPKFIKDGEKTIRNPDWDPNAVVTDDDGNLIREEDLRNKELGIKQETSKDVSGLGKSACEKSGSGGQWCESVDSRGKPYAFCMSNDGSQGNCNNRAIELGYTIQIGNLQNVSCECKSTDRETGVCTSWAMDADSQNAYKPYGQETLNKANELCNTGKGTINFGSGSYICREGKAGKGGVVYTGGACTETNGFSYNGNLGCFCGTVQVDTPNGHTSYSSTCGCDNETPEPSTPTLTSDPTLMCKSLTRTPTTAPKIGDRLTFTCAGASTPAGAVNLTYKFRYSLNSGAYIALNNATPTTAELMIASCGNYKVQCQACGTIKGTLTCDPTWSAATQ